MSPAGVLVNSFALTFVLATGLGAAPSPQARLHQFDADLAASGLIPVSWATESPTLAHLGFSAMLGLEYDPPFPLQFRLEAGYIRATPSSISPDGELYRGWEGFRIAFLFGYAFASARLGNVGLIEPSLLTGGALTSADFTGTALAYAYPSLVLEPRGFLRLRGSRGSASFIQGPWVAVPVELMFRSGGYTLTPGVSLGWRYRLGAAR